MASACSYQAIRAANGDSWPEATKPSCRARNFSGLKARS